jgi:hypothetical protein
VVCVLDMTRWFPVPTPRVRELGTTPQISQNPQNWLDVWILWILCFLWGVTT